MQEYANKWSVGQWMTKNPKTVSPEISVKEAFFEMRFEGFRHLLVMDKGKLLGIVTDRDLRCPDISDKADGWDEFYNLDDDYEVRFAMTTNVKTLAPGDHIKKAVKLFVDNKFGAVPILNKKGKVIGILSSHDLFLAFAEYLKDFPSVEKSAAQALV